MTNKMTRRNFDIPIKLLLVGISGVGKASFLSRFSDDGTKTPSSSMTGIDFKIKTLELGGKKIKLQIWHTAGEQCLNLSKSYCGGAQGIILVYDITNAKSFDRITGWLTNMQEHSKDVEKMILGNKCDLEDKRVISRERAETLAVENGVKFLETSCKDNTNIEEAFIEWTKCILDKHPEGSPPYIS